VPAALVLDRGLRLLARPAVQHQGGQEVVEVREVPVQHALGHACLVGDGARRQPARAVPQQDPLGGREEPVTSVLQTFGGWGRVPAEGQRQILEGIGEAIDGLGGSFTMGYATVGLGAARS
jgi:hypothetical protein